MAKIGSILVKNIDFCLNLKLLPFLGHYMTKNNANDEVPIKYMKMFLLELPTIL